LARAASRFQAEILRLKECIDAVKSGPATLVLLDEILAGTNSVDRHAGTVAVLRHLLRLPAVTLIATHDLALSSLTSDFGARLSPPPPTPPPPRPPPHRPLPRPGRERPDDLRLPPPRRPLPHNERPPPVARRGP